MNNLQSMACTKVINSYHRVSQKQKRFGKLGTNQFVNK